MYPKTITRKYLCASDRETALYHALARSEDMQRFKMRRVKAA